MAVVPAGIESPLSLGIHGPGESGRCKTFPPNDSRRTIPDETDDHYACVREEPNGRTLPLPTEILRRSGFRKERRREIDDTDQGESCSNEEGTERDN